MTRIGLIQMRCEKGAIRDNLEAAARYLEEATARDADIVCFPEASLTGYVDPRKYPRAVLDLDGPEVAEFLRLTEPHPATVLAGLIERNPAGKPFVTQIVARRGELLGYYRKATIENEDADMYSAGREFPVFRSEGLVFGIAICADIGNVSVFAEYARQGAAIVFEAAAPGLYGEQATRNWRSGHAWWEGECHERLGGYARERGLWILVATQAGRTIDEDFPGGGYVFAPGGERVFATADWSPGAGYFDLDVAPAST